MASLLDDQHGSTHPLRSPSQPLPTNSKEMSMCTHLSGPGLVGKCAQASEIFLSTFSVEEGQGRWVGQDVAGRG